MNNSTQQPRIPQLRFPAFDGEWEKFILGEIATFGKGKNISKSDISEDGVLECIRYGELYTEYNEVISEVKSKTNLPISSLILSEENDVLIPASGETRIDIATASCVKKAGVALGGDLNIIKTKKNGVYLSYYLNSEKKFDIARLAQGNSVVHVYNSQLKTLKLNFPSQLEQQKIATFLTAVDDKISQLTSKKEQLTQYKKGVMQQLFSQELRFQDENGKQFPDWEEKRLGEVLKQQIREIPKPKQNYLAIGIRSHVKGTFQKPDSDPNKIAMKKLFVVKENDLVVNITFAWEGAIAIVKKEDDGGLVSHRFPTYTFKENQTCYEYFKHIIVDKKFRFTLDLISPGGAGRNRVLSKKEFLKIKWSFPSLKEQQKIATYLSALDDKIEAVQVQIEKTQEFKKGLLQQLFV
ncbi:putative type I restriction-modification specificity subunit [Flavobacteria bacterium BBFL7]|nr:putative type I restriction-modification specificity subunit [Flavobacteria bacterium BBFL7]